MIDVFEKNLVNLTLILKIIEQIYPSVELDSKPKLYP